MKNGTVLFSKGHTHAILLHLYMYSRTPLCRTLKGNWKSLRGNECPSESSLSISWSESKGNEKSVRLSDSPTYPGCDLTGFNCTGILLALFFIFLGF